MPPQQAKTGPALMEGVERTNAVVVRNQGQGQGIGLLRRDPYAMDIDRERNCYACGGFGNMAQDCRNKRQEIKEENSRRLEYGQWGREGNNKHRDNLKEGENLESLNWILQTGLMYQLAK